MFIAILFLAWLLATLTPEQRTLRARIAANTRWSGESGKANAERGQAGLRARFTRDIRQRFPDLGDAEIARRAENAYRAHMQKLAFRSSKTRSDTAGAA